MRDEIQDLAEKFCADFGLVPVRIEFAEGFSKNDLNLFNFLLKPKTVQSASEQHLEMTLENMAAKGRHDAMKDYLWRELVANPKTKSLVAQIEIDSVKVLRAAIEICERKRPVGLANQKELERAQEVAARISKFHAEGKAIHEFKNLLELATRNAGKMPLIYASSGDIVYYVHEAIHYILLENRIFTDYNPFDEGMCSFLHMRFQGKLRTFRMYYPPLGRGDYLTWSKFFFEVFANTPNGKIGPLLKRNLKNYLFAFRKRF